MFISRHTVLPGSILHHPSAHIMIIAIVLHTVTFTLVGLPLLIHSIHEEIHMDEGYLDVVALVKTVIQTSARRNERSKQHCLKVHTLCMRSRILGPASS